jgi:HD-GYP domain-containing protein (c-di-GMP phosphodiesterase class II)
MFRESADAWSLSAQGATGHGEATGQKGCDSPDGLCTCGGSCTCGGMSSCAVGTAHELAESLGRAVDARDCRLFEHSTVVADVCSLLAQAHGLTALQADVVHMAGHLHDVGKIGIPDSILQKPGPLTSLEWEIMRRHPKIGADILRPVRVFRGKPGVCEIVLAHHERWDGLGYPYGIGGRDIPLGARIVAVADALSAMTEERPYRRSLSLDEALAEVERCSGSHFDPCVVRDLLSVRRELHGLLRKAPPSPLWAGPKAARAVLERRNLAATA